MPNYSLGHVQDHVLLRDLTSLVVRDRQTTAELLAHIGEVDARGLYRPKAYPCMRDYCVGELRMSEEVAYKRIHAARAARRYPAIYAAVADGRLHVSAVVLLAPYLDRCDAGELLGAAAHRTKAQVELLLASRFPVDDVPTVLSPIGPAPGANSCTSGDMTASVAPLPHSRTGAGSAGGDRVCAIPLDPDPVGTSSSAQPEQSKGPEYTAGTIASTPPNAAAASHPTYTRLAPLSATRFALQITIADTTREKLRRAQELLGHAVPSGDVAEVLDRALDALIARLEKRKYAASDRPRRARAARDARTIPAHVRRAVRERDGGRCTFTSDDGRRCESRTRLEFHHVISVARGGTATVEKTSLRCRAHNQLEAERELGARFVQGKREHSRRTSGRGSAPRRVDQSPRNVHAPAPAEDPSSCAAAAAAMARLRELLHEQAPSPTVTPPRT